MDVPLRATSSETELTFPMECPACEGTLARRVRLTAGGGITRHKRGSGLGGGSTVECIIFYDIKSEECALTCF